MAYRDTDYQNQHGVLGPVGGGDFGGDASGASAVGAVLTGSVAPTVAQPYGNTGALDPGLVLPAANQPIVSTTDRVKLLQLKLNSMGANLVADGVMGPKTQAAMTKYGIDVNGNPVAGAQPQSAAPSDPAPANSSAPAPAAPAAANPADIEQQLREKYGYLGTVLLDNPEIHKVLMDAIAGGWGPEQVQGALMGTNYWKTTQSSIRNFDTLQGTDPASANSQIQQQMADINQTAARLGVAIDPTRLQSMATDSLRFGWDATQLQQAIGNEFHYTPQAQGGTLGQAQQQLRQMASDYLVPLSDSTLSAWEAQIAQGAATADTYKNILAGNAKSLYGDGNEQVARQLDAGNTMQQIVDPYRQLAAKDLGISPDSIDFTDPKWMKALSTTDPKTGTRRMMTLNEWQQTYRGDPADAYGFQQSPLGKQMASQMTATLAQALGKLAA